MLPPRQVLHAPWREKYLRAMAAAERPGAEIANPAPSDSPSSGCFLADYWGTPSDDVANLVVLRRTDEEALAEHRACAPGVAPDGPMGGMVLLNLYPYANGHLLVALGEGRSRLLEYSAPQRAALWRLVDDAMAILERALEPQGVNIGVNQGRAAGAGLPQHAHAHLVPRWNGDVNFMTVVGEVRVIPAAMETMAALCRTAWARISAERAARGKSGGAAR